jgi:hypothetical protein
MRAMFSQKLNPLLFRKKKKKKKIIKDAMLPCCNM